MNGKWNLTHVVGAGKQNEGDRVPTFGIETTHRIEPPRPIARPGPTGVVVAFVSVVTFPSVGKGTTKAASTTALCQNLCLAPGVLTSCLKQFDHLYSAISSYM